jgi:hypothetical protein
MSEWISVKENLPNVGQNVIAFGTWYGEIHGQGESGYTGIGTWMASGYVKIDSDTYCTDIVDVTHWMPLPEAPKD